jgi:glycosyltransferase involved in cell wall biosynthesis
MLIDNLHMKESKLNILHIIPLLGCGGAEVLLGDIVKKQIELGYHVLICCLHPFHPSFDNFPKKQFLLEKVPIKFVKTRVVISLKGRTKIKGDDYKLIVDDFKPNIIHSHLFEAELIAMSYILTNIRYVSHIHDNIVQFRKFHKKDLISKKRIATLKERAWILKRYLKVKPVFLCISKDVIKYIKHNLPSTLTINAHLLPNSIDLDRFSTSSQKDFSCLSIVSVGNLVKKKNHILLIEIASLLREKSGDNFKIEILGFGPLFEEINQKIRLESLDKNVFLRGSVGNVDEYYRDAIFYVHTATYEPFGLVLIEAMASGLPVISLDGSGNRDLIHNGENGILLTENNASLFVDTILSVFQNQNYYFQLAENGLNFSKDFGIDSYITKLHQLYTL